MATGKSGATKARAASKKRSASKKNNGTPTNRGEARTTPAGLAGAIFREASAEPVVTDARIVILDVPGSQNVSQDFKDKVMQIADRLGTNPNFLMAVMSFESGLNPRAKNRFTGATGLIQFMPSTARGLRTTIEAIAEMSAEEQLDLVEQYFKPYKNRLLTIEDAYMAVLWPKAIGKKKDYVLFEKPSTAYQQNSGLDVDRDGRVTVFDATDRVRRILSAAGAGVGEVLRNGSTGPEVEKLQDELVELGHLRADEKLTGPGNFGNRTERAVKEFQTDNHLTPSGTYDAETQKAIRQLNAGVRRGSVGNVVRGLQSRLVKLRNMTNEQLATGPGFFGERTEAALKLFQQQHGILANGVLNGETYKALLTAAPLVQQGVQLGGTNVDTLLPSSGRGYKVYNREPGGADQYGRAATIRAIQDLAEGWADVHTEIPIYVGDISLKGGGPFAPHATHRDGRDVDFRPFKHNGVEGPTHVGAVDYDHVLTRELVLLIRSKFPTATILFNDRNMIRDRLTKHAAGHHNHLHVRLP